MNISRRGLLDDEIGLLKGLHVQGQWEEEFQGLGRQFVLQD